MIKNKYKKMIRNSLLVLVILFTTVACSTNKPSQPDDTGNRDPEVGVVDEDKDSGQIGEVVEEDNSPTVELDDAIVTYIDVGQGDGQLIEVDGLTILIDAGTSGNAVNIMKMLDAKGIDTIDYMIGTHPHADHIGGLPKIIDAYEVSNIVLPKVADKDVPTTKIYNTLLTSISNKPNINVIQPDYNKTLHVSDDGNIELTLVSNEEAGISSGNLNNYSASLMFRYGDTKFLFTGDAEKEQERVMLQNVDSVNLKADVFAAGHHGSNTSNTLEFMNAVSPEIVIISAGEGNRYNHPDQEALDIFDNIGAKVYQTMEHGDIIVVSNGKEVVVK